MRAAICIVYAALVLRGGLPSRHHDCCCVGADPLLLGRSDVILRALTDPDVPALSCMSCSRTSGSCGHRSCGWLPFESFSNSQSKPCQYQRWLGKVYG